MVMMVTMVGLLLLAACGKEILMIQNLVKWNDYGEVISIEELPYIYERTYHVEKSGINSLEGTGLGLR